MIKALYVHIPYCKRKCSYCDFLSFGGEDEAHQARYVDYLCREIALAQEKYRLSLTSIYIGGGTPGILSKACLKQLLETLQKIPLAEDYEFTVEANPESLSLTKAKLLVAHGVNRVSLGAQSLDEKFLKILGRAHTAKDVETAVDSLRSAGIENINLDLMYALPSQSLADWQKTLQAAVALEPAHLSAYQLQIEEGTYLAKLVREGKILPADEDTAADMLELTRAYLPLHGYHGYELSNYAKDGFHSRHNCVYWRQEDYLGLGLGATSFIDGAFVVRPQQMSEYYQALAENKLPERYEELSPDELMGQFIFMGLRLDEGVSLSRFRERFGRDLTEIFVAPVAKACRNGLAELNETHFRLTEQGKFLANEVMCEFLA